MKEITVYAVRTETVRRLDPAALAAAMPERWARSRRFRFEKDRLLCLGAGFLMTEALGIRHEDEIRYGKNGKPFAPGYPAFNLSHSGCLCVLATGGGYAEIGIDIEEINERHTDVAPSVYTPAELDWMREKEPTERFFQLWTWKESVMKATGLGMSLEARTFEVLPFITGRPVRIAGRDWYAADSSRDPAAGTGSLGRAGADNCLCSLCADAPVGAVRWTEVGQV